jgi:predicted peptidase
MPYSGRCWLSLLFPLLLPGLTLAAPPDTGFLDRSVNVGGTRYRFQVYVPPAWNKSEKWPIVLFLHGYGESGDDGLKQTEVGIGRAIRLHADRFRNVLVVLPQCRKGHLWTEAEEQAQALSALESATREFHGDREHTYVTGLSMGGYGTWDIAIRNPKRFAALVVVCGGIRGTEHLPQMHSSVLEDAKPADPYAEVARRIGKVPVWIFHGSEDPAVPVEESRKMVAAIKAADGVVRYTEYPGVGHDSWNPAYEEPELMPWLLAQSLGR